MVVPIIPVQNKYLHKLDKYSKHCSQCTGSLDESIPKIRNSNFKNSLQNIKKSEVVFFSCFRNFYNVNPCRSILLFAVDNKIQRQIFGAFLFKFKISC